MDKFKEEGVYTSDNAVYITDQSEENTVTIFKSSENKILVTTEYDFGVDGLSITLNEEEIKRVIDLLKSTLRN